MALYKDDLYFSKPFFSPSFLFFPISFKRLTFWHSFSYFKAISFFKIYGIFVATYEMVNFYINYIKVIYIKVIIYIYIYIYIYDSQIVIVHHNLCPCFNLFVLHNNPFDNQGREINKNDIFFYASTYCLLQKYIIYIYIIYIIYIYIYKYTYDVFTYMIYIYIYIYRYIYIYIYIHYIY